MGAQFSIGVMYYAGKVVAKDNQKARYWLTKAAEQGFVEAKQSLVLTDAQELGVAQDYQQAKYLHQKTEQ